MAADKGSGPAGSASAEIGKYLDILARDPNSRVFAPLAEAYRKAGLLDDAVETALEGLKVHPNYLGGRVALGRALFERKQYGEAADELRKVVKAAPDNIVAHKVLGQIALAQGNLPDAERSFRMVTLLDAHDQEAKSVLADIGGAAATAPAPVPQAPAPVAPPPVEEFPWREMSLETALPLEGPEAPVAPAEESLPSAPQAMPEPFALDDFAVGLPSVDLEEPDETPPLPGAAPAVPEPEAVELPALEGFADEGTFALPDIEEPPAPVAAPLPEADSLPEPGAEPGTPVIEIFGREPAGSGMPSPPDEDSPFELFGREKHGVPAPAPKGGREAYAEIELETTAHAPSGQEPEAAPGAEGEDLFEVFTREPRGAAGSLKEGYGERSVFEEMELEPTAYLPPEPGDEEPPVIELREEIPRIDVQGELELALEMEQAPEEEAAVPLIAPEEAATEELVWEEPAPQPSADEGSAGFAEDPFAFDVQAAEPPAEAPVFETPVVELPVAEAPAAEDLAVTVPPVEIPVQVAGLEEPPLEPEAAPARPEPTPRAAQPAAAGRGVFDTETLATIYINQGFYGRAAAIYERLVAGSPDDEGLRRRFEEVRVLARAQEAPAEEGGEAPAAARAGRPDRAETVRRLEALLEAFRGGRPL